MISSANALKFSMWLAATHPQAFAAVLKQVRSATPPSNGLNGVQGTYIPRAARRGRLGDFEPMTIEAPNFEDMRTTFDSSIFSDPVLQEINFSADDLGTGSINLPQAAASIDNSGGFWSTLGSGLSSIGSGLSSAIGTVARAVTNPQVLQAAGSIAGSVIQSNNASQQAQLQQAVLQAQMQRTGTSMGAAPLTYAVNPATGRQQPYYYNAATGQYQLTAPNTGFGMVSLAPYLPYLLIGGGLLVAVVLMRR